MILFRKIVGVSVVVAMSLVSGAYSVAHAAEGAFPEHTVMAPPPQPTKLPEFEFANINGGVLKSSDMKGKVIVIRFWATW
jgi:cytochrome oxidase Cu insertion factor (SCO1/SenC/PrrC family)